MKTTRRRRRFLIDRLQIKLLLVNLLSMLAVVLVFVAVIFGPLVVTTLDESTTAEARLEAADRMLLMHASIWPAIVTLIALFSCHSVLYTHRIAGPLYRFRNVFKAVGGGGLRIRAGVRDKDHLRTESEVINEMIEGLSRRVRCVRDRFEATCAASRTLSHASTSPDPAELPAAIESLLAQIEGQRQAIDQFDLPDGPAPERKEFPLPEQPVEEREPVHS